MAERTAERELVVSDLDAFNYSVSHDLRSPLAVIDGFSRKILADHGEVLSPTSPRMLGSVLNNAGKMAQLIDGLLAFSRPGRKPVVKRRLDMGALAAEAVSDLCADDESRRAVFHLGPLLPADGDVVLLREVWANLLSNALKYSCKHPQPRIEIDCMATHGEQVYSVKDNGTDFDMQDYGRLFGAFQRLHPSQEFPGSGIGLTLVQRIVNRHGGRVLAESRPGEGSTFYFSLPSAQDADGQD
ncbi:MAG: ATP-binding protein [Candidatus Protistobacter heckmanni]|nr:ATP-binding protein [Candidatus Protistobacter heckmanni]